MKYPLHDYLVQGMEKTKLSEWTSKNMDRVYDKACRGSEVPLRVLWCKAKGGGGRLRQATGSEEARKDIYIITNPVNGRSGVGS